MISLRWVIPNRYRNQYRPPRTGANGLPDAGDSAIDAISIPEIWDFDGPPQYSTWEYVNNGVSEGWLEYIGHHWTTVEGIPAFVTRFELLEQP